MPEARKLCDGSVPIGSRKNPSGVPKFVVGRLLLELGHIGQVLRPSNRPLVGNQVFTTNEWHLPTIYFEFHSPTPRLIKTNPIDAREEVDAVWWVTQLDNGVGIEKIFTGDIE
jgi:hypothetical protein